MHKPWIKKIVSNADVPPGELVANDHNWRSHPDAQKQALQGAIEDVGFIRSVTVNQRTGRIIDGHLRVKLALETGQETIPVEYVDLTEEEEAEALATIDPLAALAETNREKLVALLEQVRAKSPAVTEMLAGMARKQGIVSADGEEAGLDLPPSRFEIIVQCEDEGQQKVLFEKLTEEGLTCRVLTF